MEGNSFSYSNGAEAKKWKGSKVQKDPQVEAKDFFKKLSMWGEDSQTQFMRIVSSYTESVTSGINELIEEVTGPALSHYKGTECFDRDTKKFEWPNKTPWY